ncbi:MAG: AI-2E family transporter [Aggregatilineales bacterium]
MGTQPPSMSSSRWSTRTKRTVALVCLLVFSYVVFRLSSLLPLLLVATIFSYLLLPVTNAIEKYILKRLLPFKARSLAVLMTFVGVLFMIGLIMFLIVPVLLNQIVHAGEVIPEFMDSLEADVNRWLSQPLSFNGDPILIDDEPIIPLERFQDITGEGDATQVFNGENFDAFAIISAFFGSLGQLTGPAFSVLGGFLTAIVNMVFLIVIMFFFIRDGEKFAQGFISLTPESYRGDVRRLLYELGSVWNAYLRGQLLLCSAVGIATYFAALILGLPNPLVFGLLAGILEFIPNLGPTMALIPAFLIALFSQSATFPFLEGIPYALVVLVTWIGIQNLESLFLVPRIMGGSLNLHPVVVIMAVITGATVAGALGIILAAPAVATLRLFGLYLYGKLFDMDPFPLSHNRSSEAQPTRVVRWILIVRRRGGMILVVIREMVGGQSARSAGSSSSND